MLKKFILAGASILMLAPFAFVQADTSVIILNEKVTVVGPQTVSVEWTTNVPATGRVVYGPVAQGVLAGAGVAPQYGYASSTVEVATKITEHAVLIGPVMGGMAYFRPVSSDGTVTAVGKEMSIDPSLMNGSCAYVTSYLKQGAPNDPEEVKKLQAFLRGVEKDATVSVTGVFDDATAAAVSRFQSKYKNDVLAPWGVDAPTGHVYIMTKRKINEIFCSIKIALTKEEQGIIDTIRAGSGGSMTEIGQRMKISNGTLVSGDDSDVADATATGTAAFSSNDSGRTSAVGGASGKLSAFAGEISSFLSRNQLLLLFAFIAIFITIYLLRNRDNTQPKTLK